MGLFGLARNCWEWCKEKATQVKDWAADKLKNVRAAVTNLYNKFSGKDTFDEATKLYKEITERYNSRRQKFDIELNDYVSKIESHVDKINKSKEKIKRELFVEMSSKMKRIKDIPVSSDFIFESYEGVNLSFDHIRSKEQLFKIDFDKHKFKCNVQAILTLGFYTRKKAKETLYAVQEEEMKINAEIVKMDTEIIKLAAIEKSLDNVEHYFTSLIEIYENLLVRLESSVDLLTVKCLSIHHRLIDAEMSIKKLPSVKRNEIMAIITVSKVLNEMVLTQILNVEEKNIAQKYDKDISIQFNELNIVYKAA